jgi:mediator of RNA polymerase II transcription subunit 17
MASSSASPFSLRPWPTGDKKPKNLGEFITRINAERGGFRNVTEAELRDEILAKDEGRLESGNGSPEGDSDSDEEVEVDKSKTIIAAREEFLRNIEFAHQSAMLSLDFVSLLLSKEMPNQASVTLSPALRELVGIGVLGASKLHDSNVTSARSQDDHAVSTGWRLIGINKMVDSVVAAAERLEKEISLETKYWADVLAVSENGWAVASLPHEPHTLGVRYGFAEAAPDYRDNSIAPLRRNDDGTVRLDRGRVGGGSQRIHVVIERNGRVTGKSRLPGRTRDGAPLQDRVLEARNTIFSQELWYEINREARTLLSVNVRSNDSTIVYNMDAQTKIIFTLEDLTEPLSPEDLPDNQMAETVVLGLHFLLVFAHRLAYYNRTQKPQPPTSRNAPPYHILRRLILRLKYDSTCRTLTYFLTGLTATLQRAGISTVSFTQSIPPVGLQLSGFQLLQLGMRSDWQAAQSEALIINSAQGLELSAEVNITPEARIILRGRSFVSPVSTQFQVEIPGPTSANSTTQGQDQPPQLSNPLAESYPPVGQENPYPNVDEVIYYVRQATVRAIVEKAAELAAEQLDRNDIDWSETMDGAVITDGADREISIEISESAAPVLSLRAQWLVGKDIKIQQWTWGAGDDDQEKIEDLVVKFFKGEIIASS